MKKTARRAAHTFIIAAAATALTGSARLNGSQTGPGPNCGEMIHDVKTDATGKSARVTRRARIIGYWSGTRCA